MTIPTEFGASGLVVMRTPLLPRETLDAWTDGLRAASADDTTLEDALTQDRTLLRERLQALLSRPEVADAIFLASPDIMESIGAWRREPDSKKGRRTEQGLVRYFLRMVTRSTPFGLFSGCTPGRIGEQTRLALTERNAYRRHSRLDMDYLHALCEHLARIPEIRSDLTFRPNSTLYETAGRLRFAESRVAGRQRTYHLVAFDAFDALRDTLQRARGGARLRELAEALVASDPDGEITMEDAAAFVDDVVDNQLLLPDLALAVTGDESTADLLQQLEGVAAAGDARTRLAGAAHALASIDRCASSSTEERYRLIARELEPLGVPVELRRLFQVDLIKPPSDVVLGENVVAEILRGVEILHLFSQQRGEPAFDEFRSAFSERYGSDREVPLLVALDEENGIGYERAGSAAAEASPLLAGLPLRSRVERQRVALGPSDAVLLQLLVRALGEGRTEIELIDEDLARLQNIDRPPLPDAFHAMATIAATSPEAVERGDYRVHLHFASGPSGARMLGRFCHADAAIREGVEQHLAAEEALRPGALFAEIVHLPAGRIGNILARPVLRKYEIPFLGRSGAPEDAQIPLDDLLVSVSGDRIRLRSKRLDREVIPRLTSAHNTTSESLGVYRFLAAVSQGLGMQWNWGPLETLPFLPRIVSGRLVLARARWRIMSAQIQTIAASSGAARYRAVQRLREEHRMPRYVVLTDGDHELLVDFENVLALDAVVELVRNREDFVFTELYPAPDQLCAEGPEGSFFHELVIPFAKRAPVAAPAPAVRKSPAPLIQRTFAPGSEWLFAKFYTGTATADRVLAEEIAPLAADAIANSAADRWFFIRYSDPHWHLRIRFHGDPRTLRESVQPALQAAGSRLLDAGLAWKVQFDTYEREVERYGGAEAIDLVEEIFFRDSVAVIELLEACSGDAGSASRAPFIAAGIDTLLRDFGCDAAGRLRLAETSRDLLAKQFQYEAVRELLAERFRRERGAFQRLVDESTSVRALQRRSEAIAGVVAELIALERRGRLQMPLQAILQSVIHMFVNRLSRSAGPEHELVVYDYLVQLYRSQLARSGGPRVNRATALRGSR
ncbi:MAG: lantibiotic biosynthesis protein [Acidobacteriota bacterium]|jgi:thiopeptide-type bacteriocin biosynthesis protein|nr:lantibiotic biosynthesis protein [Acidobacteriota bacterium]